MVQGRRHVRAVAAVLIVAALAVLSMTGLGAVPTARAGPSPLSGRAAGRTSVDGLGTPRDPTVPDGTAPRTILGDAPCNTSTNVEVAEATDASLGYLFAAWVGCGGIGFSRSIDGGYSFQAALAVPGSTTGVVSDPSVAVAPNGTVYVAYIRDNVSGDAPMVAGSFDHGASFAAATPAFTPAAGSSSTRDALAVAPNGTVALTWIYSPDSAEDQQQCDAAGDCWFTAGDLNPVLATSADDGTSWSAAAPIDPSYPSGGITAAPIAIGADGALDVLLIDHAVGGGHVLGAGFDAFTRSVDGGAHWTVATNVSSRALPAATPWVDGTLALDPNGTLYAAFDATNGSADDAYVAASLDNGTTWSAALRVSGATDSADHGLVTIAAATNGTALVAWLSNNSSAGWRLFGATLAGDGSAATSPTLLSNATGLPTLPTGATLGVVDLGQGAFGIAWSFGITYDRLTATQVLSVVTGESAPTDAPSITSVVPGAGQVTVGWLPPIGGGDRVTGFVVVWGLLNQRTFYNLTYPRAATFALVTGLPVDYAWYFEVAAVNGAGVGPSSAAVNVTLRAWGVLRGTIDPANATLEFDDAGVVTNNGTYLLNTTIGLHLLSASAPGHAAFVSPVTLPWNGTVYLNVSLALLPGAVSGSVSPLNATVLFDGAPVVVDATGHFALSNVSDGTHVLSASDVGFVSVTRNVTVRAGATTWANLTLLRANGTLRLTVAPATAVVRFNGSTVALSVGGTVNLTVAPGVYVLNVSAAGFYAQQENVTIVGASTVPLSIVLIKQPAPSPPTTGGSGLSPLDGELVVAVTAGLIVAVAVAALTVRRRRQSRGPGSSPPTFWEPDATDGGDDEPANRSETPTPPPGGG